MEEKLHELHVQTQFDVRRSVTVSGLKYLSSRQALEDVANFIRVVTVEQQLQNAKWIVWGGSYAGNLAAWFRQKYPQLAYGAIASSAPVLAELDFDGECCNWVRAILQLSCTVIAQSTWK